MSKGTTNLSSFDNSWYQPGGPIKRLLWYFTNLFFLKSGLFPINGLKISLLRMFGASIGQGVVIKPIISIKYPWNLTVGDHSWIGDEVWIDNLGKVTIGSHVCLSQGAMLLCGNHDFKSSKFDLLVGDIVLEDGVWIGAHAVVCPGVTCKSHAVLSVNSVATKNLDEYTIYQGNPAQPVRKRELNIE